jgi:hypothetical protein
MSLKRLACLFLPSRHYPGVLRDAFRPHSSGFDKRMMRASIVIWS